MKAVVQIGTFDSKGLEHAFLRQCFIDRGLAVIAINVGILGTTQAFRSDIEAEEIAQAAGCSLAALRAKGDRGEAVAAMARGAEIMVSQLHAEGKVAAVVGMGGSAGTTIATAAMRSLPLGIPKICLSTLTGGNTSHYVGISDVILFPTITDVAGVNRISQGVMFRAAGALAGMLSAPSVIYDIRPVIATSMFGNTTPCVDQCRELLGTAGFETLVFHATGNGGRTMEMLIRDRLVDACLDITTTEWADEICGGVLSAGPDRLKAAGQVGIPHLIVPGCVDMVNFGPWDTVPSHYRAEGRLLHQWNPSVTLMRTNVQENRRLGEIFAGIANQARGPVGFLLPLQGVSLLDSPGQPFFAPETDKVLYQTIRSQVNSHVKVYEVDANINDAIFANHAVEILLNMMNIKRSVQP